MIKKGYQLTHRCIKGHAGPENEGRRTEETAVDGRVDYLGHGEGSLVNPQESVLHLSLNTHLGLIQLGDAS